MIEPFHPERMASRILGMGDVLSLIEKAEQTFDEKKAAEYEKKFREQTFSLNDYLDQFAQIRKMGSIDQLIGMMPGIKPEALKDAKVDEKQLDRVEAIILSMTIKERYHPELLNSSRRFIEEIGYYDPMKEPAVLNVDNDKAAQWIKNGAQPTDTVRDLLKRSGAIA